MSIQSIKSVQSFFFDVAKSKKSLLLLDYDGTLAPFQKERDKAYPFPGVRERLNALIEKRMTKVVVVSGRNVQELPPLLDLHYPIELWGCHGWERLEQNGTHHMEPLEKRQKLGLGQAFSYALSSPFASMIEQKPFSIALHWRGVEREVAEAAKQSLAGDWKKIAKRRGLELFPFDGGVELRPLGRNKGSVIVDILSKNEDRCPVAYLGDDQTDEQAFGSLGSNGLKVLVKDRPAETLADCRLNPPQELLDFFDLWLQSEGKKT